MEKISEKKLSALNFVSAARGRRREKSPFYKLVSSMYVGECIIIDKKKIDEEAGISIGSCRCLVTNKKRKDKDVNMRGKVFSSRLGVSDGKTMFVVKRIK